MDSTISSVARTLISTSTLYRVQEVWEKKRKKGKIIIIINKEGKINMKKKKGNKHGSFRVRSTNGLRVTPPILTKFGTLADNA